MAHITFEVTLKYFLHIIYVIKDLALDLSVKLVRLQVNRPGLDLGRLFTFRAHSCCTLVCKLLWIIAHYVHSALHTRSLLDSTQT